MSIKLWLVLNINQKSFKMEAKDVSNVQLNVGVNFQAQVIETVCSETISRITGLHVGDKVQIYPHTVNSHSVSCDPKTVAVRKLSDNAATGHFIVLPISNLGINPKQLSLITQANSVIGKNDPHLTYVRQGVCSKILKRATGLSGGCRVKFYPYSVDVFIEEDNGSFSVSPLITMAVRAVNNGLSHGNFILMNVMDLNLNQVQKDELREIILDGLSAFAGQEGSNSNDAKFIFKKLKKEINLVSEAALLNPSEA